MVTPAGPSSSPPSSTTPDLPRISHDMQKGINQFSNHLEKVTQDPTLSEQETMQSDFANNIQLLDQIVAKVQKL